MTPDPMHNPNDTYTGEHLAEIAFPLGGIGAGMVCLTGRGNLKHWSLRHRPDLDNEPFVFAALHVKRGEGRAPVIRIVEAAPDARTVLQPGRRGTHPEGFPKFARGTFTARFPFAELELEDPALPDLRTRLTGWSPFIPGNADDSSLPCAALEYTFENTGADPLEAVFSWHAENVLRTGDSRGGGVEALPGGFLLREMASADHPARAGALMAACPGEDAVVVNHRWFRGGWFDAPTAVFESIRRGETPAHPPVGSEDPSLGGSLYVPFALGPGESRTLTVLLAWYVPRSDLNHIPSEFRRRAAAGGDGGCGEGTCGEEPPAWPTYEPHYAGRFASAEKLAAFWVSRSAHLRAESAAFRDAFFASTLPGEVLEAVSANLAILKSPTVLRQKDGKVWAWEGSGNREGCCHGTCTHVWGYAQALPHLFPDLDEVPLLYGFRKGRQAR
ncbi:MAG: hypothetical protein EA425_13990 [Puniceicoccaceae bacterium]|nr:MAG: hypothetical protein EA425_13990 [Puniceicoccaceae bacterium]